MPKASLRSGFRKVRLGQLDFVDISLDTCVGWMVNERLHGRGGWMVTANTDFLYQAHVNEQLRTLYRKADLVVADGMPVIWASRLRGSPLRHGRVCGSDLIFRLPDACAQASLSVFLLGGVNDVADRTEAVLTSRYPGLKIAGKYSPPFGFENRPEEYKAMADAVSSARPDFVLVALGAPKGERLIEALRQYAPGAWWIGVGASFEFACGARRRAPRLLQRIGAEWLFRMFQDPGRLVRRYLRNNLPYLPVLFATSFLGRFPGVIVTESRPPNTN